MTKDNAAVSNSLADGGTRDVALSRRDFLKRSGSAALLLSLTSFASCLAPKFLTDAIAGTSDPDYARWEDLYRRQWQWDRVTWGSHLNICWPVGSCLFHVYVRNGIVWREEQAARTQACNPDYPDYNPLGCQKGSAFNNNLYGAERVTYPLKRVGARGEGKWKRISWDEATNEIADAILDGYRSQGTDSFVLDAPHEHSGAIAWSGGYRMNALLDGVCPDVNVEIGDVYMGALQTFGKMLMGYSADNLYDAEVIVLTMSNWSYTYPTGYHFVTEARYKGAEVVVVAPDFSPTTAAADIHVPVRAGCDAAFWLGVCQVMIEEGLVDRGFVTEQTDLPLLVRTDTHKFLSGPDVDGGRPDQFYYFDEKAGGLRPASRGTLQIAGQPALEGTFTVALKDGTRIDVQPVFEILRRRLRDYAPEKATALCGVPVSLIRELARKIATKRTCNYIGFSSGKHYHGDLMERSLFLAMALSGNWGKPGTGFGMTAVPEDHILLLAAMKKPVEQGGLDEFLELEANLVRQMQAADPDVTDEMAMCEYAQRATPAFGVVPPAQWLYHHVGYRELYDNKAWADPDMSKTFGACLHEAIAKGWMTPEHIRPAPDKTPQVLMLISHNPLRRQRGGMRTYPQILFPKLRMIFALETRMSSSAMYADIVLPGAWYYEKHEMTPAMIGNPFFTFIDRAVAPPGECKEEWAAMALILKKVGERARARGILEFTDHLGQTRRFDELYDRFTMNGHLTSNEDCLKEQIRISTAVGVFPAGTTYEQFRRDGQIRFHGLGAGLSSLASANRYDPSRPFYPLAWHVDRKKVFPTHVRRAQFYIDHDWYLEAGEALPTHKTPPPIGGDHPFTITSGHPRVSIHSVHLSNAHLSRLHRGQPVVHVNPQDAAELGLADGDMARLVNDFAECETMIRTAPNVQPKQCVAYMWEVYQYRRWMPFDSLSIGMPKALHLAGGYRQLGFWFFTGSPQPATDRGVRVSIAKA